MRPVRARAALRRRRRAVRRHRELVPVLRRGHGARARLDGRGVSHRHGERRHGAPVHRRRAAGRRRARGHDRDGVRDLARPASRHRLLRGARTHAPPAGGEGRSGADAVRRLAAPARLRRGRTAQVRGGRGRVARQAGEGPAGSALRRAPPARRHGEPRRGAGARRRRRRRVPARVRHDRRAGPRHRRPGSRRAAQRARRAPRLRARERRARARTTGFRAWRRASSSSPTSARTTARSRMRGCSRRSTRCSRSRSRASAAAPAPAEGLHRIPRRAGAGFRAARRVRHRRADRQRQVLSPRRHDLRPVRSGRARGNPRRPAGQPGAEAAGRDVRLRRRRPAVQGGAVDPGEGGHEGAARTMGRRSVDAGRRGRRPRPRRQRGHRARDRSGLRRLHTSGAAATGAVRRVPRRRREEPAEHPDRAARARALRAAREASRRDPHRGHGDGKGEVGLARPRVRRRDPGSGRAGRDRCCGGDGAGGGRHLGRQRDPRAHEARGGRGGGDSRPPVVLDRGRVDRLARPWRRGRAGGTCGADGRRR